MTVNDEGGSSNHTYHRSIMFINLPHNWTTEGNEIFSKIFKKSLLQSSLVQTLIVAELDIVGLEENSVC